MKIHFAHRTFAWESEARGKAHVHVVIIGFGAKDTDQKRIYEYNSETGQVTVTSAWNISPYLVEGNDIVILSRSLPISTAPKIIFGNMPNDGGHLILNDNEKAELAKKEPIAARFIRPFVGAVEFIHGDNRWCLWLKDVPPTEWRNLQEITNRVNLVRQEREASRRPTTRELAKTPALFGEIRQPATPYLVIPKTSSERRRYIPIAEPTARSDCEYGVADDS